MTETKVINGTTFSAETPERVAKLLLGYMNSGQRIRIFLGTKDGRDWGEIYRTIGYVGRSTGSIKIPLLISNSRSIGGEAISDANIVRITVDRRNAYIHPKYRCEVSVKGRDVYLNGKLHITAPTVEKAKSAAEFLRGNTNRLW